MGEELMEMNGMDIPAEVQRSGSQGPGGSRDALCAQIRSGSGEFLQGEFISPVAIKNEGPTREPSASGSRGEKDNPSVSLAADSSLYTREPLEESGVSAGEQSPPCVKGGGRAEQGRGDWQNEEDGLEPAPAAAPDPRLDEVRRFAAHFPGVQGEDVPPEVWDMVRGGLPLTAAYAIHQNRALRFELETLKQNAAARERSTGSMTGLGERHTDPLDEGWYDD